MTTFALPAEVLQSIASGNFCACRRFVPEHAVDRNCPSGDTPLFDALTQRESEYPTASPTRRAYLRDMVEKASAS